MEGPLARAFTCPYCEESFPSAAELISHGDVCPHPTARLDRANEARLEALGALGEALMAAHLKERVPWAGLPPDLRDAALRYVMADIASDRAALEERLASLEERLARAEVQ